MVLNGKWTLERRDLRNLKRPSVPGLDGIWRLVVQSRVPLGLILKAESGVQMTKMKSIQATRQTATDCRQDRTARRPFYQPQIDLEGQVLPDVLLAGDRRFGAAKVALRARLCGILMPYWQWDSRYCLKIRENGKNRPFRTVGWLRFTLLNFSGLSHKTPEEMVTGGNDIRIACCISDKKR